VIRIQKGEYHEKNIIITERCDINSIYGNGGEGKRKNNSE
jgi:hypothetical protein